MKDIITPINKAQLKRLIKNEIELNGNNCNLNHLNTSLITDMSEIFHNSEFNGDIFNWNVSKVTNMSGMFWSSKFNRDLSKWNVSNITNMISMFENCLSAKVWWSIEDNQLRSEAINKYNLMNKLNDKLQEKTIIQSKKRKI